MNATWSQVQIDGKPADLFESAESPRYCVIFLHPVGQETLAGNAVWTALLDKMRLACICPQGKFTWWSDKISTEFDPQITAERYILDSVIPFCNERWQFTPP